MSTKSSRWISPVYSLGLSLGLTLYVPRALFAWARGDESLRQRIGKEISPVQRGQGPVVWVHAVSFGETKAVCPLLEEFERRYPEAQFVFSTVTQTGYAEGIRSLPQAARHLYLPLDFRTTMRKAIQSVQPDLVLITETDYWYHFLRESKAAGAQVVVVNGKVSERSARRYCRVPWLAQEIFGQVDHFCVQSDLYRQRFLDLGMNPQQLTVTGNIKFDASSKKMSLANKEQLQKRLGVETKEITLVAGSTHDPEEELFVRTWQLLKSKGYRVRLILVPRHPQRFDEVARLLKQQRVAFWRYTQGGNCPPEVDCVLIDAMGLLRECYQVADLAIVAGSFTPKVGGHNLLEPCFYSVPVVFGPHMHSQPELTTLVLQAGAGCQTSCAELANTLLDLCANPERGKTIGKAGYALIQKNVGAIGRTLSAIESHLPTTYHS